MKTSTKISLIMRFQLKPDEINFVDSLNLSIDYQDIIEKENYQLLSDSFSQILAENRLTEPELLMLAYINSKIKGLTILLKPKFENDVFEDEYDEYDNDIFEEDPEIREYNKEQEQIWREKMKRHREAVNKYKEHSQEEFDKLLFEYVWKTYPQIKNGFDRTIYRKAKTEFITHLGFYNIYQTTDTLRNKINKAVENVKIILMEKIKELEISKIEEWSNEYNEWLSKNGISKSTKGIIKEFFKEKGIKASDSTIEKIKNSH